MLCVKTSANDSAGLPITEHRHKHSRRDHANSSGKVSQKQSLCQRVEKPIKPLIGYSLSSRSSSLTVQESTTLTVVMTLLSIHTSYST